MRGERSQADTKLRECGGLLGTLGLYSGGAGESDRGGKCGFVFGVVEGGGELSIRFCWCKGAGGLVEVVRE